MAQTSSTKCNVCNKGLGSLFCHECKQSFCDSCNTIHAKFSATQSHFVTESNNIDFSLHLDCDEHKLGFAHYCLTCEALTCSSCVTTNHYEHAFTEVAKISANARTEVSERLVILKEKMARLSNLIDITKSKDAAFLKKESDKYISNINQVSDELKGIVNSITEINITRASEYYETEIQELKYSVAKLEKINNEYELICSQLEQLLLLNHDVAFCVRHKSLTKELDYLDDIPNIEKPNPIETFNKDDYIDLVVEKIHNKHPIRTLKNNKNEITMMKEQIEEAEQFKLCCQADIKQYVERSIQLTNVKEHLEQEKEKLEQEIFRLTKKNKDDTLLLNDTLLKERSKFSKLKTDLDRALEEKEKEIRSLKETAKTEEQCKLSCQAEMKQSIERSTRLEIDKEQLDHEIARLVKENIRLKTQLKTKFVSYNVHGRDQTDVNHMSAAQRAVNCPMSKASVRWPMKTLGGDKQASVGIGDISLKIYQGDITEAEVDVIVNETNRELDLTRGLVSRAILNKGGDELMKNLRLPAVKREIIMEGITVTHAGMKFNCQYILHVDMEDRIGELKDKFKDVLQKVYILGRKSVAFPPLGAEINCSMEKVAVSIFEALISFEKKKTDVKEVHVVIFQADMLSKFLSAMELYMLKTEAQPRGLVREVIGFLGYGKKIPVKPKQCVVTKNPKSNLNLTVYAKNQNSVDAAFMTLEENMISDYVESLVEDHVIKELSYDQEAKIMKIQNDFEVEIEVSKRLGRIKMYGLRKNVSEALDEINKIIRDLDRKKQKHQHAKLVADIVQWYFISVEDTGQKLKEYPPEVNLILEQALRNNDPQAFFLDNCGNKYIVDFNIYEEYPEDDPTNTVAVLRKSIQTDSAFDMPANWAPMDQNEKIKIVTLQATDKEYLDLMKDFQTQMGGNYASIIKVEKIQSRTLQQQYVAKKKLMDSTNPPGHNNEMKLWHGTTIDAIDSINTYGFNRSYCGNNAFAYGNGVYFAVNPTFSAQSQYARPDPTGNKRMYLCKVLVGEFTKGQGGMKVPPPKQGAAGHILYDSVVDNPSMPGIYVIFHDTQAYPEYLIVFK